MPTYEIIYDYCNDEGSDETNLVDYFTGTWDELQEEIQFMKTQGCYNFSVNQINQF